MAESKQRIQKWDILKLVLIFLVVLGHALDIYTEKTASVESTFFFIYSFHMPLFLFVSGLFSKRNIDEKRYTNILSYLVLYIFTKGVLFLGNVLFEQKVAFNLLSEDGIPWYALALFNCSLIAIAVRKLPKVYVLLGSILLACLVGYDSSVSDFLVLSRTIVFFPFFFAGYALDAQKLSACLSKWWVRLLAVALLGGFALFVFTNTDKVYWLRPLLTGRNPFHTLGAFAPYGGLIRLAYYPIVALLCACVIALIPNRIGKGWLAGFGERSVQIFTLHMLLLDVSFVWLDANDRFAKLLPAHPKLLYIPLSALVVLLCGLKLWSPLFDLVLHPTKFCKKQESA